MRPSLRTLALASLVLLTSPHAVRAQPVIVDGAVGRKLEVDGALLDSLGRQSRLMKAFDVDDRYLGTFEQSGAGLKRVLEAAGVVKKTDDGFSRPLDVYLVAASRSGRRAVFSYGEVFNVADPGAVLLADRSRYLIPGHHDTESLARWDRGLLGPAERERLDLGACAACHGAGKAPPLASLRGLAVVPATDRRSERFLSDLAGLHVCRAGPLAGVTGKKGQATWVEEPTLVLPDGRSVAVTRKLLRGLPVVSLEDASFGEGRGYGGEHARSGVGMAALLRKATGHPLDVRRVLLLVTASDGYRSVYSGGELALSPLGEGLILADREDGKPLGPRDGRYRLVPRLDFFADRSVRSVKELRVVEIAEGGDPCGLSGSGPAAAAQTPR